MTSTASTRPSRASLFAFGLLAAALAGGLAGCAPQKAGAWQGYLEGEYVHVAAPFGGQLTNLAVARGDTVRAGQLLFQLDSQSERAAVREAQERLAQAQARLDNLRKGRRPSEIASLEAQLNRARANLELSEIELKRREQLREKDVISPAEFDTARARRDADAAQVATLKADLETARLGAREDEVRAAEADVQSLNAALAKASWDLAQKQQAAPTNAVVHDTLYRPGEFVGAGMPVVSLLPPANLKVRFFVPEPELAAIKVGQRVQVSLDGVPTPLTATVSYIATQAEFTPPVIYSQENRAKFVYLIEARFAPEPAAQLHPGQPADVRVGGQQAE